MRSLLVANVVNGQSKYEASFSTYSTRALLDAVQKQSRSVTTGENQASPKYSPIYVAATRQHVGKTSVSLALMSGLQKRFERNRVGFLKPVGQQSLRVRDNDGEYVDVDKDAALLKQHYNLDHITYQNTSPVLIPSQYTKDYLDERIKNAEQMQKIRKAFDVQSSVSDVILCEGTGHVAVGSIVDASNVDTAKFLGAKIVLVANGGIGNSFDELELNRTMCEKVGVELAGVVINKVKPSKYDQTKEYLTKALLKNWGAGVPILGCIPDRPFLGCPALADLERLFNATLISGTEHRLRHYRVSDLQLVATSLEVFLKNLRQNRQTGFRRLYVCHASRDDILLGYLMESVQRSVELKKHATSRAPSAASSGYSSDEPESWETAMVVTGCDEYPMSSQILDIVTNLPKSAPPVLMTATPTDQVMQAMYQYTPKLNSEDGNRVEIAVQHYEKYINYDLLLDRVTLH